MPLPAAMASSESDATVGMITLMMSPADRALKMSMSGKI
jgi:hypothetical protein